MKFIQRLSASLSVIAFACAGCVTGQPSPGSGAVSPVSVKELVRTTNSWDGTMLPPYPLGQPEITIKRITIPAGARLDTHFHPVINAGILTRGRLTVVKADGSTLELKAGDPIVELVNRAHFGINTGKTPAEIVIVYAGAVGQHLSVPSSRPSVTLDCLPK